MTKEMLNKLKDFEIFVEKMEAFVDGIQLDGYPIEHYDLRMPTIEGHLDNIYSIPHTIKDYAEIWQDILFIRENITEYYKKCVGLNTFFDVYWNNVEGNNAEYTGETLWIGFNDDGTFEY